jgi:hypothetical protein
MLDQCPQVAENASLGRLEVCGKVCNPHSFLLLGNVLENPERKNHRLYGVSSVGGFIEIIHGLPG